MIYELRTASLSCRKFLDLYKLSICISNPMIDLNPSRYRRSRGQICVRRSFLITTESVEIDGSLMVMFPSPNEPLAPGTLLKVAGSGESSNSALLPFRALENALPEAEIGDWSLTMCHRMSVPSAQNAPFAVVWTGSFSPVSRRAVQSVMSWVEMIWQLNQCCNTVQ